MGKYILEEKLTGPFLFALLAITIWFDIFWIFLLAAFLTIMALFLTD